MTNLITYFKKLIKGEISFLISFWVWFIGVSIVIEYLFETDLTNLNYENSDNYFNFFINLLILIYSILIFIVIFRSAQNYKGSKAWKIIAKIMVTINLLFSINVTIDDVKYYFFQDYLIGLEIEKFKEELPLKVDYSSELIDIKKDEKIISYFYKFYNITKEDLNKIKFEKQVQESLCEDETSLHLLKKDYVLNYIYLNENKEEIFKVVTNKISCGKSIYDLDILKEILKQQGEI